MIMNSPRINQLLRQARKERFWAQTRLAREVGVDKGTISRWENGVCEPRPDELGRLCKALEKSREELGYPLESLVDVSIGDGEAVSASQEISIASLAENPPTENKPSDDQEEPLSAPAPPRWSRRFVVKVGVLAAVGLAGGGTATWLLLTHSWESHHWPTVGFDLHHRTEQVRVIQWMLKARQYDIGPTSVDGIFGSFTENAVIAFQGSQGLAASGQVDGPTWEKLIISSDVGSTGSQVFALQECLNLALSLAHQLAVDGNFGPKTAEAVRQFRQQQNLTENGGADLDVWRLLVKKVGEMSPE